MAPMMMKSLSLLEDKKYRFFLYSTLYRDRRPQFSYRECLNPVTDVTSGTVQKCTCLWTQEWIRVKGHNLLRPIVMTLKKARTFQINLKQARMILKKYGQPSNTSKTSRNNFLKIWNTLWINSKIHRNDFDRRGYVLENPLEQFKENS